MIDPTPKQTAFLLAPHKEVLFGGAAGGGKSVGVLAAASQYLDVPGYSALILRQTYRDLALAGALMDMGFAWWKGTKARWKASDYTWFFPEGGTLTFGYLETEKDKYRYQGSEYQFIGFDELTQFETESRYLYLFSRMRRLEGFPVPLRVRAATNPGGIGHEWVKRRFISDTTPSRIFIPSSLEDNPYLDQAAYDEALSNLDPITRQQLREGDWEVDPRGGMFKRAWFGIVNQIPDRYQFRVRYWDLAATTAEEARDPDWTVGLRMLYTDDHNYIIDDVIRFRGTPQQVENKVSETAIKDGWDTPIFMEQEPGSSGKGQIDHYRRNVLAGYDFHPDKDYRRTSKELRAKPLSSAAEEGHVFLLLAPWVTPFLDEHIIFPDGTHDDQVDASVGAHAMINKILRKETNRAKGTQRYGRKKHSRHGHGFA